MDDDSKKGLNQVIYEFLAPSAKEFGELIADNVRYYRWRSAESIIRRTKKWAEEEGIKPGKIPLRFIVPFLENCSLEEEDTLGANCWSSLLLEAATHYDQKYEVYLKLLSTITSDEVKILHCLHCSISEREVNNVHNHFSLYRQRESELLKERYEEINEVKNEISKEGRIAYVFEGKDIPNTNEMTLTGCEEINMLMHLEALNLVILNRDTFLIGHERGFVFIADITPLGYDFVKTIGYSESKGSVSIDF